MQIKLQVPDRRCEIGDIVRIDTGFGLYTGKVTGFRLVSFECAADTDLIRIDTGLYSCATIGWNIRIKMGQYEMWVDQDDILGDEK